MRYKNEIGPIRLKYFRDYAHNRVKEKYFAHFRLCELQETQGCLPSTEKNYEKKLQSPK